MPKLNPYCNLTKEEEEQALKKEAARKKLLKETEELANKCINHEYFAKYKDKYIKLREVTIEALINYEEVDPLKYAMGVKVALANLHQLKLLLHDIQADNRGKK